MPTCTVCGRPFDDSPPRHSRRGRPALRCSAECRKIYGRERSKKWREDNPERYDQLQKDWYDKNKDAVREKHAEWDRKNRDRRVAKNAEWYAKNRDKECDRRRVAHANNRSHILAKKKEYHYANRDQEVARSRKWAAEVKARRTALKSLGIKVRFKDYKLVAEAIDRILKGDSS